MNSRPDPAPPHAPKDSERPGDRSRFYNPALDGLRFFAFFGVLIHHAVQGDPTKYGSMHFLPHDAVTWIPTASRSFGGAGVDLFFVLSAYLITSLLLLEKGRVGRVDVRAFYIRRALRIWPLYFAVLALLFFTQPYWKPQLSPGYFVASALFLGNWALASFSPGSPGPITPLWSVSLEEQYYVVWPWVVGRCRARTLALIGWGVFAACVAVRFYLWTTGASYNEMSANSFARMAPIGLGVVLAADGNAARALRSARFPLLWMALCGMAIVALERPTGFGEIPSLYTAVVKYPATALLCMAVVASLLREDCDRIPVLTSPPIIYLGRISYGLYMFHALAMELVYHFTPAVSSAGNKFAKGMMTLPVIFLVTVVAAALSFRFFERPFLSLKDRFTRVRSGSGA